MEQLGLADIRLVVRLMCLAAAGRANFAATMMEAPSPNFMGPLEHGVMEGHVAGSTSSLTYLSAAIGSLASSNPNAAKLLVQLCTKVRTLARTVIMPGLLIAHTHSTPCIG